MLVILENALRTMPSWKVGEGPEACDDGPDPVGL